MPFISRFGKALQLIRSFSDFGVMLRLSITKQQNYFCRFVTCVFYCRENISNSPFGGILQSYISHSVDTKCDHLEFPVSVITVKIHLTAVIAKVLKCMTFISFENKNAVQPGKKIVFTTIFIFIATVCSFFFYFLYYSSHLKLWLTIIFVYFHLWMQNCIPPFFQMLINSSLFSLSYTFVFPLPLHSWLWLCPVPSEQHDGSNTLWLSYVHGMCFISCIWKWWPVSVIFR